MKYNLIEATDSWMTRQRIGLPREPHLYPSEGSAKFVDKKGITRVAGACLRRCYYRYTGTEGSAFNPYTMWIFALGKSVEEILVEEYKQMGIWVANNIKFYDKLRNISGEIDIILSEPDGTLFGVEVKSFYGYAAGRDLIGNTKVQPSPKTSQLMQTLIYLEQCSSFVDYFKMVYYARDSAARTEFDITITETEDGERRPTINGIIDWRFTMKDVYDRYAELMINIETGDAPARDFDLVFSPEKVEERWALKEISKSAYEKWQKNPVKYPIGDWQCRYCNYCNICWNKTEE